MISTKTSKILIIIPYLDIVRWNDLCMDKQMTGKWLKLCEYELV